MQPQTTADYATAGSVVDIPGLGRRVRAADDVRYDYRNAKTRCPICQCDGAGMPWGGWFSCELSDCCDALVATGEVFVRDKASV